MISDHTYIAGTPSDVWSAITSPEKIPLCYWGSHIEGEMTKGAEIAYVGVSDKGEKTRHCWGEVLDIQPNKVFSHTANLPSHDPDFRTTVVYAIEAVNPTCTKLTLTDDGWPTELAQKREQSIGSWKMILAQVKTVVETGKMLDTTPASSKTEAVADSTATAATEVQSPTKKRGSAAGSAGTPTSAGSGESGSGRPKRGKKQ